MEPQEIIAQFEKDRGFVREWHRIAAENAPEVLQTYLDFSKTIMTRPALPNKTAELILIALDADQKWPGIKVHIRNALRAGATKEELVQTMIVAGIAGGVHTMAFGLVELNKVLNGVIED